MKTMQRKKSTISKDKKDNRLANNSQALHFSPLGWVVLFGPLSIVLFLLIFGEKISWIMEQSSLEASNEAEESNSVGREVMKAGNYREAYSYFASALKIQPDYTEPHINIGKLYYQMGEFDKAVEWLKKAIAFDPPQKDLIYNNLGMMYAKKGDQLTAISMFEKALSIGMQSAAVYKNIGAARYQLKDYQGAIEAFSAAIELKPDLKSLYEEMLKRTVIDFFEKDDEEFGKIVQAAKDHIERGVKEEELAVYDSVSVRKFLQNSPKRAIDYFNLARALESNEELESAIINYEKSLRLNPRNPQVYLRIGIIALKQNENEKAVSYLRQALTLDPNNTTARRALNMVQERINNDMNTE
ncbi:MAG: tetratricopeptide repeat protein [Candidatus Electryonea clarkiae]|nr:tetratricopeptide repeat protein [Candidatus Electryonea clarkiae]MDP8286307.1 tetratricopeptide repeat protein [Candidatus Electryonea clarkiae]